MFAKKKYHMIGDSNQKGAGLEKTKSSLRTVIYLLYTPLGTELTRIYDS